MLKGSYINMKIVKIEMFEYRELDTYTEYTGRLVHEYIESFPVMTL